jgi:hypothetical protein
VETAMSYPITYSNVGRHNISGEEKKKYVQEEEVKK